VYRVFFLGSFVLELYTITYIIYVVNSKRPKGEFNVSSEKKSSNKTEIKMEFLGTAALNNFIANTSSPRAVMDFNHVSQHLPLLYPDERIIKSGIEYELGKYINDVRVEHDCIVKAIIPKYREYGVLEPPLYTIIVEYEEDGYIYIDYINIDTFRSAHTFFGYRLKPTADFFNIGYNTPLAKGTILATTDSYGDEGDYRYGLNANVAFMSHPSVSEDGFVVSESFIKRAQFHSIIKRVINITKDTIPINLYGTKDIFKFIPDIGEKVRPDGLLCALRTRNDWFSISDINTNNISEPDYIFDNLVYVNPNSTVIDINIVRGNYNKPEFSSKMTQQLDQYAEMLINYYRNVVNKYEQIMQEKKIMYGNTDVIKLSPRLNRFITDCQIKIMAATYGKHKLSYRKLPIDQYRIEITTISTITPNLGFKMTDIHAAKGVICRILPDEMMPVDELGNRVDVITDSMSTISRMNLGRAYEAYLGAVSRDNRQRFINQFTMKYGNNFLDKLNEDDLDYIRNELRDLYSLINTDMTEFIDSLNYKEVYEHFKRIVNHNLSIYYPTDNEKNIIDVIDDIEKSRFAPHLGKLTYIDELGNKVTTEENIRVGQLYFMFLEKIANNYSGVSSSKVNNFGFPVKGTNIDKSKYPHSLTPTKTLGETEVRILESFAPPEMIADLIDITLNPISHKLLIKGILESPNGFDPNFNIDRSKVEYGQTKSLMILKHIFNACGFDFTYEGFTNAEN